MSVEAIYLVVLATMGCCTSIYLLFADFAGKGVKRPLLEPAVVLSFMTFTAMAGYTLEKFTVYASIHCFVAAMLIAAISSFGMYYFLLMPLRTNEMMDTD